MFELLLWRQERGYNETLDVIYTNLWVNEWAMQILSLTLCFWIITVAHLSLSSWSGLPFRLKNNTSTVQSLVGPVKDTPTKPAGRNVAVRFSSRILLPCPIRSWFMWRYSFKCLIANSVAGTIPPGMTLHTLLFAQPSHLRSNKWRQCNATLVLNCRLFYLDNCSPRFLDFCPVSRKPYEIRTTVHQIFTRQSPKGKRDWKKGMINNTKAISQ